MPRAPDIRAGYFELPRSRIGKLHFFLRAHVAKQDLALLRELKREIRALA